MRYCLVDQAQIAYNKTYVKQIQGSILLLKWLLFLR